MIAGIIKEQEKENRVAIVPADIVKLKAGSCLVEKGAGDRSYAPDSEYEEAGARIVDRAEILKTADVIFSVNGLPDEEIAGLRAGQVLIGMYNPLLQPGKAQKLAAQGVVTFSMELVPRSTRAQAMDVLSSMATIAGYKASLRAADTLPSFFPMFMTAAGSVKPAKVLILGAGVAGLQAIATARRLGAVVEAFDVRSAVKEEVESLGAKFIEVEGAREDDSAGGYAVEQSEEFIKKQRQMVHDHAVRSDVIITTAQIPGKKAPMLVPAATVEGMRKGSVIIDLAAASGGNCEFSKPDQTVVHNGVTILGPTNLPSEMPRDASSMYGKNLINFFKLINKEGELHLNFDDDIVAGTCLTRDGQIVNERVNALFATAAEK